jgi:hypothetical protein
MLGVPFYYTLLLLCWSYAALRGGAPERIGATVILAGSLLTLATLSTRSSSYGSVETGVFVVDLACLTAFLVLALRAERFWPTWVAALQLLGTSGHLVKLVDPTLLPRAYAFAAIFWTYPMLLLLVLGTWRHQQRLKRFGVDRSWSNFSARSGPPKAGPTH